MKPSEKLLKIDSFPDADFAGIYGHEAMDDPTCVKITTGHVNMVANCVQLYGKPISNLRPLFLP